LHLEPVLARAGGLDREQEWNTVLSLSEQQLLACPHLLLAAPRFVFLDQLGTALSREQVNQILQLLADHLISYLSIGKAGELLNGYDAVLEIADDGGWKWMAIKAGKIIEE
jgi:putative ATP-binding cassette transporter